MWEGSVERNCGPRNKNRIKGVADQGERAPAIAALRCRYVTIDKIRAIIGVCRDESIAAPKEKNRDSIGLFSLPLGERVGTAHSHFQGKCEVRS